MEITWLIFVPSTSNFALKSNRIKASQSTTGKKILEINKRETRAITGKGILKLKLTFFIETITRDTEITANKINEA